MPYGVSRVSILASHFLWSGMGCCECSEWMPPVSVGGTRSFLFDMRLFVREILVQVVDEVRKRHAQCSIHSVCFRGRVVAETTLE